MSGFVPEGDKLHQLQSQRPGMFIGITESGRIFEICVFMETQTYASREWPAQEWKDAEVATEMARVDQMLAAAQQNRPAPPPGQQQYGNRGPAGPQIVKPASGLVPGTI